MDAASNTVATMVANYEVDWIFVAVAVTSFALVYVALNLSTPRNATGKAGRQPQPAARSVGTDGRDTSLSSTLKGKVTTPSSNGGSPRPARRQSLLRSPRKTISAMTGMSGFFSGKGKGRSSPEEAERRNSSPPSPFESAAAARGDKSLASKPSATPTPPVPARPGPASDRHGLYEFCGLWDMVEVQELDAFMVARGVSWVFDDPSTSHLSLSTYHLPFITYHLPFTAQRPSTPQVPYMVRKIMAKAKIKQEVTVTMSEKGSPSVGIVMHTPLGKKEVSLVLGEPTLIERPGPPGSKKQMLNAVPAWDDASRTLAVDGALKETGEVVLRFERQLLEGGKRMRFTERFLEGGRSGEDTGDYVHRFLQKVEGV